MSSCIVFVQVRGVHSSCVWHLPPLPASLLPRQEESEQSLLFSFFACSACARGACRIESYSLVHCYDVKVTLKWYVFLLLQINNVFSCFINLTLFQVFVSLRQNDQELASMYDQVILNIWISRWVFCFHTLVRYLFTLHLFSAESHGQPQKLNGGSDGRGRACPRGQNFGENSIWVKI